MATYLGNPKVQYFESGTAEFLSGGKLYSYEAGTLTPAATYPTITDANASSNPNTNPVILDSRGEADVVVSGSTKLILKDSDDNTIWTVDEVASSSSSGDILDSGANVLLGFVSVVNAVNYLEITNAASGDRPKFAAAGSDLNIGTDITAKGSGTLFLDGGDTGKVEINGTSTGDIDLKDDTNITGDLSITGDITSVVAITASGAVATGAVTTTGAITATGDISSDTNMAGVDGTFTGDVAIAGNTDFLPTGMFIWHCAATAPTGWLHCDGSAVNRTTYAALFTAIGTTFGVGDGSTTFNLPDTERKAIVGEGGTGTGELANTVGSTGGTETTTMTEAQMPAHTHDIKGNNAAGGSYPTLYATGNASTRATESTGSGSAQNNIQPSLILYGLIRHL